MDSEMQELIVKAQEAVATHAGLVQEMKELEEQMAQVSQPSEDLRMAYLMVSESRVRHESMQKTFKSVIDKWLR